MSLIKRIVSLTRSQAGARALELVLYAVAGLCLLAALAAIAYAAVMRGYEGLALTAVIVVSTLAGAALVSFFSAAAELYGQRARDIRAQAIFETLRRGEPAPPFSLYLRPFASTGAISEAVASSLVGVRGLSVERVELETQVERAARPIGPLVALGAPLEHIGAGRIQVPEDGWQDAIQLLMGKAALIVMLPSSRAGTLAEIDMILGSDLIRRTVLVDPPNLRASKTYDHAAEWTKVRDAFRAHAFELPADTRAGALLFFGDARAPRLREHLDIDADDRIERLFRRVLRLLKEAPQQAAQNQRGA